MDSTRWKSFSDKKETFFETEKGGRILKIGVHYRSEDEGNIMWYLKTRSKAGEWTQIYLSLDDMEEVGLLLLILSKFCEPTMFLDRDGFSKIQNFKRVWDNLRMEE